MYVHNAFWLFSPATHDLLCSSLPHHLQHSPLPFFTAFILFCFVLWPSEFTGGEEGSPLWPWVSLELAGVTIKWVHSSLSQDWPWPDPVWCCTQLKLLFVMEIAVPCSENSISQPPPTPNNACFVRDQQERVVMMTTGTETLIFQAV